jgi:hypothetical protein
MVRPRRRSCGRKLALCCWTAPAILECSTWRVSNAHYMYMCNTCMHCVHYVHRPPLYAVLSRGKTD